VAGRSLTTSHEAQLSRRDGFSLYRPFGEAERREPGSSEGVVLDYDAAGNLVGIDIDNASKKVDLQTLILSRLPGEVQTIAA
jgi:uncharacterized protein YuzE